MYRIDELLDVVKFEHSLEQRRHGHFNHEAGHVEGPFTVTGLDYSTPSPLPDEPTVGVITCEVDPSTGETIYRVVRQ
jgi:hypothetical protein